MSDLTESRLFVYGTLAPGRSNEHVLAGLRGSWEEASTMGRLCEQGWGAAYVYPAIILGADLPEACSVSGYLFTSVELLEFWCELDEFEGEAYQRSKAAIVTSSGEVVSAYTYELNERYWLSLLE